MPPSFGRTPVVVDSGGRLSPAAPLAMTGLAESAEVRQQMFRLRTLGTIDLRDAQGNELRAVLVQPRRLALLVALALSRPYGFQRRDRLAALFWPEDNSDKARAALSRAIYFLRGHLGDDVIISRGAEEIGIDRSRLRSDAETFAQCLERDDNEGALDAYGGELLPAFFASGAPGFEEWLEQERNHLRSEAAAAAAALAASEEASGNLGAASRWARRAVELAPFDEVAVRRLLGLLDRSGDRAGATQFFQQFSQQLHAQLGVAPAPETRRFAETISAREESARTATPVRVAAAPPGRVAEMSPPPRRRRRIASLAAAVPILVMLAWLSRERGMDPFRVDVAAFRPEGSVAATRALGDSLAKRLFSGLVQAGLVRTTPSARAYSGWRLSLSIDSLTSGRRRGRDAGTSVSGSWREDHDSVRIRVHVVDYRRGGQPWEITAAGPVDSTAELIDRMGHRIAGAVAVLGTSYATLLPLVGSPPGIEAWREFVEGLRLDGTRRRRDAVQRYRLAASLDSTFLWPLVHAAIFAPMSANPRDALSDSVLIELTAARNRLRPLERRLCDYAIAVRAGKWEESYRAIREAAVVAPEQFSQIEAIRASSLHRPRDAIAALTRPVVVQASRANTQYWTLLAGSYHVIGDHHLELTSVRSARASAPSNASLMVMELSALSALGLVTDVLIRIDSLVAQPRDDWLTTGIALTRVAEELRAHGHATAATAILERAVEWFRSRPAAEAAMTNHRYFMGATLYLAGELDAADSVFRSLQSEDPREVDYVGYLGVIAARKGNRADALRRAKELVGREAGAPLPGDASVTWRAGIAALLGDRSESMRLLSAEFGPHGTEMLHLNPDFDSLRTYAPFRELVRPKG